MELQAGEARYLNEGKAVLNKKVADHKALADSIIFCTFAMGALSDEAIVEALNAVTGFDWSAGDLYEVGERGIALDRMFNVREGLRRNWDTSNVTSCNQISLKGLSCDPHRLISQISKAFRRQ